LSDGASFCVRRRKEKIMISQDVTQDINLLRLDRKHLSPLPFHDPDIITWSITLTSSLGYNKWTYFYCVLTSYVIVQRDFPSFVVESSLKRPKSQKGPSLWFRLPGLSGRGARAS